MTKYQKVHLNFWAPTWKGWGDRFCGVDMPYELTFDWVKVEAYNEETKEFGEVVFEDEFDGELNLDAWEVKNKKDLGISYRNIWHPDNVKTR